jgi:hypothetical protein
VGVLVFIVPLTLGDPQNPNAGLAALGLALIMSGLMIGGTWLTMQASRLLARFASGPSSLLAARRMADNPKAAFRSVSGLVLAVFVGTFIAGAVPAALAAQKTPTDTPLNNVLRVSFGGQVGLDPHGGATLVSQLQAFPGVSVLPVYVNPSTHQGPGSGPPPPSIIGCASLTQLSVLGQCAPGVTAVEAVSSDRLFTQNLANLNKVLPLVTRSSTPFSDNLTTLTIRALLVKADSTARVEKVRTFLTVTYPGLIGNEPDSAPQTFGEVAQVRAALYVEIGNVMLLIVGLTLLVAGCSLAIAMGGGMVERKRPFTLLRVSGTATRVLQRVVLLESVLPLVTATVVAAATGFGLAIPVGKIFAPKGTPLAMPGHTYYLTMGAGLIISLAVISMTLPLLDRITVPANARFE